MASSIDIEAVRKSHQLLGENTPFYKDQTTIPPSVLNQLVETGMLRRGGRKGKGYIWTEGVHSLLSEADSRERRLTSMRSSLREIDEPRRGMAYGTRRRRSLPDGDGNSTDKDSIDES